MGIRLPLPIRLARPGKTATTVLLSVWGAAVVAFLICLIIYAHGEITQYHLHAGQAAPPDHVAPFTFTAVVVVFFVILLRKSGTAESALPGAFIGAIAAPFIFEFPFDVIISARLYPPLHPDPALYRVLFFAFALMLAVFAVWALKGFAYPGTAVPLTLNVVSKALAFVTLLTLFFPRPRPELASVPAEVPAV